MKNKLQCKFCKKDLTNLSECYPHDLGGYCISPPKKDGDIACNQCKREKETKPIEISGIYY